MPSWNPNRIALLFSLILISAVGYLLFGYYVDRSDHFTLVSVYIFLFSAFYLLVSRFAENIKLLSILSIAFRLLFILAIPGLSQDFYRFIWDGRIILAGYNPYIHTPLSLINAENLAILQADELVRNMGTLSAGNMSNYPPVNQLFFAIAGLISGKSVIGAVVVMRSITLLAEIGILIIGVKFLKKLKLAAYSIFWYSLNPLIIIELTGNLHFESVMLFFLLLALYLIYTKRWKLGALAFAVSVSIKLIPLIFVPLLFKKLGAKQWVLFCAIVGGTTLVLFVPFLSKELFSSYMETTGLWFQKFEFNASIYYLFREIGYVFRGYNEIAIIGIVLSSMVFVFVLYRSLNRTNANILGLLSSMLLVISVYFFTATTVHPWYIATPLLLSVFTSYKYVRIWSLFVILSYLAYISPFANESYIVLFIEYAAVYAVFFYEMFVKDRGLTVTSSTNV